MSDAQPVAVADLYALRFGRDAAWSPDGKTVVFSSNQSGRFNYWTMPADGGSPVQLTQSDHLQTNIVVTPYARALFHSDVGGNEVYDLFETPIAGGRTINLTSTEDVSEANAIASRDGRFAAFERRSKEAPSANIAVIDLASRTVRELTREASADRTWTLAGFTADGRTLIATRSDFNYIYATIYAIDLATGAASALTDESSGFNFASAVSGDGRYIALTTIGADGVARAAIMDGGAGEVRSLKPDVWEQTAGHFSPDGATLVFTSNVDGRQTLFAYDVKRAASRLLPLPPGVSQQAGRAGGSFSPDSRSLLVTHMSGNRPFDYWVVDLRADKAQKLTTLGLTGSIAPERLPSSQLVHYASTDGTVISAFVWMPFNLARDGSAPAIVLAHGGPTAQTTDYFNGEAIALASRGFVVIAPNFRGSTGYGKAFREANRRDLGGGDLNDLVSAGKFLTATGYVDPKRIGITGASYGGYLTLMAISKTPEIWAAAVEQYGIIDWVTMYSTASPVLQEYQRGLMGDPVQDAAIYRNSSPMTFIRAAKAPLLVLQGDNDVRVPRSQAEQVVTALKANGAVVEAHFYSGEGHGFAKRENQIDALTRMVGWFETHLKPVR